MQLRTSLLAITVLAAIASAQTAVIPNGLATTEGASSTAYPWGRGVSQIRVQYVYDSTNLTNQGIVTPIQINQLRWRANGAAIGIGSSYNAVTVQMATCPLNHAAASTTFANNLGVDVTTVYSGPVAVAAGAGTTPNNWYVSIPLTTPFVYDPSAGDLTFDIATDATGWVGAIGAAVDCGTTTSATSRIYNLTSFAATTGTFQANVGITCELSYTLLAGYASNAPYGTGCGARAGSFYEHIPTTPAIDLSNTAITMLKTPAGYTVMSGITTFVAPSGSAINMALGDDATGNVTPSIPFPYPGGTAATLVVCSNGFVSTASNGTSYQPSPAAFLAWANPAWAVWRDFLPTAAGADNIWREEIGGILYITWLNVLGYNGQVAGVTPSTFQFQFDLNTGNVHLVFQSMDTVSVSTWAGGEGWVIGYGTAGASIDPGSIDLSVAAPATFSVSGIDQAPLALSAAPRPVINTLVTYTLSNIDPAAIISAHLISLGGIDPGISLTGLGAPGCFQYVDLGLASTNLLLGGPTSSFFVPNDPSLAGLPLDNQGASLVPGLNALGVSTSNGVCSTIGTL